MKAAGVTTRDARRRTCARRVPCTIQMQSIYSNIFIVQLYRRGKFTSRWNYRTCATFEVRDLLRSGTTSHLTGTTQLTEGTRSQQVPDFKSRGGYPYNN
eukprot:COSAG02_NODE_141_length_34311_cov_54.733135_31_plen_98_part_01